jgi:hypothetical protein
MKKTPGPPMERPTPKPRPKTEARNPIQPLSVVEGVLRFKKNSIVRFLLDSGPYDLLDKLGSMDFSRDDRIQFLQLIGYSVEGLYEYDYVQEAVQAGTFPPDVTEAGPDPMIEESDDEDVAIACLAQEAYSRGVRRKSFASMIQPENLPILPVLLDCYRTGLAVPSRDDRSTMDPLKA